jgi:hypothetical protein
VSLKRLPNPRFAAESNGTRGWRGSAKGTASGRAGHVLPRVRSKRLEGGVNSLIKFLANTLDHLLD